MSSPKFYNILSLLLWELMGFTTSLEAILDIVRDNGYGVVTLSHGLLELDGFPDLGAFANETGGCPDGWYRLDSKCYSLSGTVDAKTWQEAREWCNVNGPANGDLATIFAPGLQSFLTALLKAFPVDMWIGLSTGSSDPTFKWADGTALDYTRWAENQPEGGTNKCVKLVNDPNNPGEWDDVACLESNAFLCQSDLDPDVSDNITIISQCESDEYQSYFDACFRVEPTPVTFDDAIAICQGENAELASLTDRYQEAFAQTVLYNNGLDNMWIGLERNQYRFPSTNTHTGYCPGNFGRFGDYCYLIDPDMRATSWSQANESCQALYGSHLVSIHSDDERDLVKVHGAVFQATSMWIGMDIDMDGEFQWSDGSVVNYVDFMDGQPSGMGNCVEMDLLNNGQWKSDDCNDNSPYFCKAPVFDYDAGGCPLDWYKLDNKCYTLAGQSSPMTWQDAKQYCMETGASDGNLATINSAGLQSFMTAILKAFPVDVWIGLYTNSTDPTFQWSDGSPVTYQEWADGQPDGGLNKCARMLNVAENPGKWDDDECTVQNAFLCQSNPDPNLPGNPDIISNCGREGYQSYFDSCFRVVSTPMSYDMAMETCKNESAQLASVTDRYQEAFVQTVLYNNRLDSMWVGLATEETSGQYQWQDEWPLTFTSWGIDQPNGEECVHVDAKGYWNGADCAMMKPFICKYTSASPPAPPAPPVGFCPSGWEQMGGNCYLFDDQLMAASWSDAHDDCQSKYGAELASVHTNSEEDFIRQRAETAFPGSSVWLGMERSMYMLRWTDKSLVDYVNWMDGEPDSGDCVTMNGQDGWSTNDCTMTNRYVCKAPVFDYEEAGCPTGWYKLDKKCYTLGGQGSPQTWQGAQQQCMDGAIANGNLATVYVEGLQSLLTAIMKAFPEDDVWIGLYTDDMDDAYKWADGAPLTYTNWADGQPDGNTTTKCVGMLNNPDNPGQWDDVECMENKLYLCQSDPDPALPGNPDLVSLCERGYQSYIDSCFRIEPTPMTYAMAMETCHNETAQLASFSDLYQEAFANTVLYYNSLESSWIGLMENQMTGEYEWEDGWPLTFTSWGMDEPSGEGCVALTNGETWDDTSCEEMRPFMCKYSLQAPPPSEPTPIPGYCPSGWDQYEGACYLFDAASAAGSWEMAEEECQKMNGASLVSLHNNNEEDFVMTHAKAAFPSASTVWAGMKRDVDMLMWSDQSLINYVNWFGGQPGTVGDCVEMSTSGAGGWRANNCALNKNYVCKIPEFNYADSGCPPDWFKLDEHCYTLAGQNSPMTWQDARQYCMDNSVGDGDLATVYTGGLQSFLTAIMKAFPVDVWIGLYNTNISPEFQWADESPVTYTSWANGQPDGVVGTGYCVKMVNDPMDPGNWDDVSCDHANAFLCQSSPDPNLPGNPDVISNCGKEGYQSYFDSCFRIDTRPMTYDMAKETCEAESSQLASVTDPYQEAFVKTVLYNNRLESMWLGLKRDEVTGKYDWEDGWPLTYTSWGMHEPSGEGCVALTDGETWDDTSCEEMRPFICKYSQESPPAPTTPETGYCPDGWEYFNGFCYHFDPDARAMSWENAQQECQDNFGTDLVSVHSHAEQEYVMSMASSLYSASTLWLGMQADSDGSFMWIDDSLVDYVKWNSGQPSMSHCVEMSLHHGGEWSTDDCMDNNPYVCKAPVFGEGGGCPNGWYKLKDRCFLLGGQDESQRLSWQDAQNVCLTQGGQIGNLATIQNSGIQSFLTAVLKGIEGDVWIGFTNYPGFWSWVDGSELTYENWAPGQPDSGSTQCAKMINDPDAPGKWIDLSCSEENAYLCQTDIDPTLPGNPDIISSCDRPGYQSYFQSCFRVVTEPQTFTDAQAVCEGEMANLASLNDLYEEGFAEVVMFNNELESAWIGLQADMTTGQYEWLDGWPLTFTNWRVSEPSRASGKGCVAISNNPNSTWVDENCSEQKGFICKYTFSSKPQEPEPELGYCPSGWELYQGHCYYFRPTQPLANWDIAQYDCQVEGAHLAYLHSNEEVAWVSEWARNTWGVGSTWIGLRRDYESDLFTWTNQDLVDYVNWASEPSMRQSCVEMRTDSTGGWTEQPCREQEYHYVCKMKQLGPVGGCPSGWYKLRDKCYRLGGGPDDPTNLQTWYDAREQCATDGPNGHLACISENGLQAFMTAILKGLEGDVWVGLSTVGQGGNPREFVWDGGVELDYTNWGVGQPDGAMDSDNCVKLENNPDDPGNWNDVECENTHAFLCESDLDSTLPANPPIISRCLRSDYQSYISNCFKINLVPATFAEAHAACLGDSAELVSFSDKYEQAFAQTVLFSNDVTSMWLGLTQDEASGHYMWSDEWPLTFTNWGINEPTGESCVKFTNAPSWEADDCEMKLPYMCKFTIETKPTPAPAMEGYCPPGWNKWGTDCYWAQESSEPGSWEESHLACQQAIEGADLLSIHTDGENLYIQELATLTWGRASLWLGMSRNDMHIFEWSDQSMVDYVNWSPNEPDGVNVEENCVEFNSETGSWNDEDCLDYSRYICKLPLRAQAYPPPTDEPGLEPTNPSAQQDLSTGEIIGIAVAAGTVLLIILIAAYYLCIKEEKKKGSGDGEAANAVYEIDGDDEEKL
ncbi:lymphocyte antigen 75-like [Amphiura filiformis]|uniref:lymphocyte antigen 75-like n=1 Tax=Amphiura filiformis TaxID=82378 RepID=UPI003B22836C